MAQELDNTALFSTFRKKNVNIQALIVILIVYTF